MACHNMPKGRIKNYDNKKTAAESKVYAFRIWKRKKNDPLFVLLVGLYWVWCI